MNILNIWFFVQMYDVRYLLTNCNSYNSESISLYDIHKLINVPTII